MKEFVYRLPENGSIADRVDVSHDALCPICLETFLDGEVVCGSQNEECPHHFHSACIVDWLVKASACPCCRRDFLLTESGHTTVNDDAEHVVFLHELTAREIVTIAMMLNVWSAF
jgi:Ring finger domain